MPYSYVSRLSFTDDRPSRLSGASGGIIRFQQPKFAETGAFFLGIFLWRFGNFFAEGYFEKIFSTLGVQSGRI